MGQKFADLSTHGVRFGLQWFLNEPERLIMNMEHWEKKFEEKIFQIAASEDPAHDHLHFKRVVQMAKKLCEEEIAHFEIVVPAAWLHDFVNVPKNHPLRSEASRLSAKAAAQFLKTINYPDEFLEGISHAIEAHSFSANIEPLTIEAKIVQDADRLDALGAIGIARCFATAGILKRSFYNPDDPFCDHRTPDDLQFTVDHFYQKLFKVAATLRTDAGLREGQRRVKVMKDFLSSLHSEIQFPV